MPLTHLRNLLACALLGIFCIIGLQCTFLLSQLGVALQGAEHELRSTSSEARQALIDSQSVLESIRGTTETVRDSAVQQMGYYESVGRRSANSLARLELLISHTDTRMERITAAFDAAVAEGGRSAEQFEALAASVQSDLDQITKGTEAVLGTSHTVLTHIDGKLTDNRLDQLSDSLTQSSRNTEAATANVAEATGYIRDMLSPKRKNFWLRLFEFMIPRPGLPVR